MEDTDAPEEEQKNVRNITAGIRLNLWANKGLNST